MNGLPFQQKVDLTLRLYGPGSNTCSGAIKELDFTFPGNDQDVVGPLLVGSDGPGMYYWQVEAAPGDLWQGAESVCGAPGSTTQVS